MGLDRKTILALLAMSLSVLVIANDFSAVNVAIPTMEKDFHTNVNTMQWVVNAYALTFGVMIVTGGRLADMFGRRRAFFLGTAIFASKVKEPEAVEHRIDYPGIAAISIPR